ncbi:unnamed protein product, partial [Rotaria socialis]
FLFGRGRNNHIHPVNSTPLNTNTKMSMEDENTESTPTTNLDNANKSTEQNNRIPSITGVGDDSIEYDYSIKAPPNICRTSKAKWEQLKPNYPKYLRRYQNRIAFNFGGAIFFNLRYFEQVYADELEPLLQQLSSSKPMIHTIVNFYFMVYCHELSHNIAKGHDEAFVQCIERVAVRFMTDKDMLLEHFSFKDSMKNLN